MAEMTAALVKELREKTGAGMMDCKRALGDSDGDIEAAVDWLRKKGLVRRGQEGRAGRRRRADRGRDARHAPAPSSRSMPRPISSPATRRSRTSSAPSPSSRSAATASSRR